MSLSPVPVDVAGEKLIARRMQRVFIIFRLFHKYMSRLRHYFLMLICDFLRFLLVTQWRGNIRTADLSSKTEIWQVDDIFLFPPLVAALQPGYSPFLRN
jgi:hypothetical protein